MVDDFEQFDDKPDSVKVSRTAKGTATWEIKIRSKDLTDPEEQAKVESSIEAIWLKLKSKFPT